jgi:hypothetical protein
VTGWRRGPERSQGPYSGFAFAPAARISDDGPVSGDVPGSRPTVECRSDDWGCEDTREAVAFSGTAHGFRLAPAKTFNMLLGVAAIARGRPATSQGTRTRGYRCM